MNYFDGNDKNNLLFTSRHYINAECLLPQHPYRFEDNEQERSTNTGFIQTGGYACSVISLIDKE